MKKIILIILVIAGIFIISACSSNNQQPSGPRNFSGRPQGNLTPEQRQQMIEVRIQQETAACQGKIENDSCTMQNPRGQINGTCQTQNATLMCNMRTGFRQKTSG